MVAISVPTEHRSVAQVAPAVFSPVTVSSEKPFNAALSRMLCVAHRKPAAPPDTNATRNTTLVINQLSMIE